MLFTCLYFVLTLCVPHQGPGVRAVYVYTGGSGTIKSDCTRHPFVSLHPLLRCRIVVTPDSKQPSNQLLTTPPDSPCRFAAIPATGLSSPGRLVHGKDLSAYRSKHTCHRILDLATTGPRILPPPGPKQHASSSPATGKAPRQDTATGNLDLVDRTRSATGPGLQSSPASMLANASGTPPAFP